MGARLSIRLKRAYEEPALDDGTRVLIDRLWPRGVSRKQLRIDRWARELAPGDELRRWFDHQPERYEEFVARYAAELALRRPALAELRRIASGGRLTLVFAARDSENCNASAMARFLRAGLPARAATDG